MCIDPHPDELHFILFRGPENINVYWDAMQVLGRGFNGVFILCLGWNSVCTVLSLR